MLSELKGTVVRFDTATEVENFDLCGKELNCRASRSKANITPALGSFSGTYDTRIR
jgi:hypothetical protein